VKPLYTPEYFATHELVPRIVYEERGDDALCFMNPEILLIADMLRRRYGAVYCNTYGLLKWKGVARTESGLRIPTDIHYRRDSNHTRGNALDLIFNGPTAQQVRADIITGKIKFVVPVIIESTKGGKEIPWLHIATGNYHDRVREIHLK